ncbi:MAG TPA: hypothetical protein VEH27_07515 [Methylomirabilota bacterium]|nr:hypothetical protein [Methylomirabilota bacterium]
MDIVDLILNLAGLLLWLSWRTGRIAQAPVVVGVSLAATLKPLQAQRDSVWRPLLGLGALLLIRSFFYRQIGSAVHWLPAIDLYAIRLPFRSDSWHLMALYSFLSFAWFLGKVYMWLLLISALHKRGSEGDLIIKHVRAQLGFVAQWPAIIKLLLSPIVFVLLWFPLQFVLTRVGINPAPSSTELVVQQALLLGLGVLCAWEFLLVGLLLLYVVNDYVYLGAHQFWLFIQATGRKLLAPFSWLPLRFARLDLAPFVLLALALYGAELAKRQLPEIYARLPL